MAARHFQKVLFFKMPEIEGIEKLFSFVPRKKFGQFNQYGTIQYGWSHYGDGPIYMIIDKGPPVQYFLDNAGNPLDFCGIYRTDNVSGYTRYYREPYYITRNPRSPDQQANRQKFADAMNTWQALTPEEKLIYYQRAKGKKLLGHNLFLREYLLS